MLSNMRIFIGVFNQRAALFDVDVDAVFAAFVGDLETDGMDATAVTERQVTRGIGVGVEMLMEPAAAGAVDAAGFPFDLDHFIPMAVLEGVRARLFRPQQDIAG